MVKKIFSIKKVKTVIFSLILTMGSTSIFLENSITNAKGKKVLTILSVKKAKTYAFDRNTFCDPITEKMPFNSGKTCSESANEYINFFATFNFKLNKGAIGYILRQKNKPIVTIKINDKKVASAKILRTYQEFGGEYVYVCNRKKCYKDKKASAFYYNGISKNKVKSICKKRGYTKKIGDYKYENRKGYKCAKSIGTGSLVFPNKYKNQPLIPHLKFDYSQHSALLNAIGKATKGSVLSFEFRAPKYKSKISGYKVKGLSKLNSKLFKVKYIVE